MEVKPSRLEATKSILAVETHADDAFLSLGWHLEHLWKNKKRTILTVFSDGKRTKEAQEYADAIGCSSICLELHQTNHLNKVTGPIQRLYRLEDALDDLWDDYDEVVLPLGLQHPDHLAVAMTFENLDVLWYVDSPYCTKQKLRDELNEKILGRKIESICYPGKRKWRHIPIFRSQAKFFHFNPMAEYRTPEIVLGAK